MPLVELIGPDGSVMELSAEVQTVDAAEVVVAVHGAAHRKVWLDGERRTLSNSEPGLLSIDLRRSTGFHRLELEGQTYWFGSTDHKLQLDGLSELLRELRDLGTGWSGQVMFSDGAVLRDPHVVYGWLDAHADRALGALYSIAATPTRGVTTTRQLTRRASGRLDTRRTLALLRIRGSDYLEKDPTGPLEVGDERYTPLRVVERRTRASFDTVWHRRCAAVARLVHSLAGEVLISDVGVSASARCRDWLERSGQVRRNLPVATPVGPLMAVALREHAVGPELTDSRYRLVVELARSLEKDFGWQASHTPLHRYSYVLYADAIYQVYAAHVLAHILDLHATHVTFGAKQPVFASDAFELYHDVPPPSRVLRSWRAASSTPDVSRPDLLVRQIATGYVLVIDAKYRSAGSRATEDSRKEVASYMALYGLTTAGIVFPPADVAGTETIVEGLGNRMIELPIRPGSEVSDDIQATLLGLLVDPPY